MPSRPTGEVEHAINSLADLQLAALSIDDLLGHIARLGVRALPGWDAAGVTIIEGNQVATYGITDKRVHEVDQVQYDTGRGPCIDAAKTGDTQYLDGEPRNPRWRQVAELAADAGVYSILSFPLKLEGQPMGALNFYSSERDALRSGQREEGWVFASQAAIALANTSEFLARGEQLEQLEQGLKTRALIGQATGLLMAEERLSSDEAFQKLIHVSQTSNVKLRDIAKRYVQAWENKQTNAANPVEQPR